MVDNGKNVYDMIDAVRTFPWDSLLRRVIISAAKSLDTLGIEEGVNRDDCDNGTHTALSWMECKRELRGYSTETHPFEYFLRADLGHLVVVNITTVITWQRNAALGLLSVHEQRTPI